VWSYPAIGTYLLLAFGLLLLGAFFLTWRQKVDEHEPSQKTTDGGSQ
jgi:hypothetical protein